MSTTLPPVLQFSKAQIDEFLAAADITLMVFTLCNSLRIVAYVPQIVKAATDKTGAKADTSSARAMLLISANAALAKACGS